LGKLIGNPRVVRHLGERHQEILLGFQKLVDAEAAAA
jgi:hypothetical protein